MVAQGALRRKTKVGKRWILCLVFVFVFVGIAGPSYSDEGKKSSIKGVIFKDENGNGAQDVREKGIDSVGIDLYLDDEDGTFNPLFDTLIESLTSEEKGKYTFKELLAGTYFVDVDETSPFLPQGVVATTLEPAVVALTDSEKKTNVDFGFYPLPTVTITSPVTLTTVGSSPIDVTGTVSDNAVSVFVNGVEADIINGGFTVTGIVLNEGMNTIAASAYDVLNNVVTANVNITLDSTPPKIFINSPEDGAVVTSSPVTVTGIINDIVRGTVNEGQASVTVNGIEAAVVNRSFIVEAVPLVEGANTITAVGADQTGNTDSASITVTLDLSLGKRLNMVSGNIQTASIGSQLPQPLVVSVNDENGPITGTTVVFRVIENNGTLNGGQRALALETDNNGQASVTYTLGTWAGSGNNKVEVTATGVQGSVIFIASGTVGSAANIHVASGGQQRGAVNQPLPLPLVAIVTDSGFNPVGNVTVTFTVIEGRGKFSNAQSEITINTDSDGRAAASLTLGPIAGTNAHIAEATFPGSTEAPASFVATGLVPGDPGDTRISGVVLDNSNNPIPGVTMRVEGTTRQAVTDEQGVFVIENVPVGPVHLIADGSTATLSGEYPTLMFELVTIAGQDNTLGMPIYLLPLNIETTATVGGNEDVVYTLPDVPGFSLTVKANSVTFPDGSKEGQISVTQVHADKIPMAPPNGLQPRFIITIQPAGAVFDPPAIVTLPNVDGLAPGEKTNLYSFDHDLGQFVSIGTGTVSEDGMLIVSDPGVGVVKAGWHCGGNPQASGSANNCPECEKCVNNTCVPDDGADCNDKLYCTSYTGTEPGPDKCEGETCLGNPIEDKVLPPIDIDFDFDIPKINLFFFEVPHMQADVDIESKQIQTCCEEEDKMTVNLDGNGDVKGEFGPFTLSFPPLKVADKLCKLLEDWSSDVVDCSADVYLTIHESINGTAGITTDCCKGITKWSGSGKVNYKKAEVGGILSAKFIVDLFSAKIFGSASINETFILKDLTLEVKATLTSLTAGFIVEIRGIPIFPISHTWGPYGPVTFTLPLPSKCN